MLIRFGDQARVLRPDVFLPNLAKTKKEALFGCKSVDRGRIGHALRRSLECSMRDGQASEIGDAFALFELAVAMKTGLDFVGAKLIGNAFAARLKILQVFRRPPVVKIAV